jgi:peptide/nickel transport system substrate-binding protein
MVEMLGGVAIPSYGSYTRYQKNYGNPFEYRWSPEKATALLKEANCYPCNITVAISTSGSGQMQPLPMNELVKAQLEAVGFKVKFDVLDWNTVLDVFIKGWQKYPQYDGVNFSSGAIDPLSGIVKTFTTANRTPLGPNWGWYQNKEVDEVADQLLNTFDETEQDKLLKQIHEITTKDAARVFIVSDLNPRALSPRLKGFVQVQSWFQDITPIVVQGATN